MRSIFTKLAATAGVVIGSGLLATTGASAQSVTTIIGSVQVGGSSTTAPSTTVKPPVKCEDAKNHGEHVSSQKKGRRSVAAKSNCGKPNVTTTTRPATSTTTTTALAGAAVTTSTRPKHDDHDDDHDGDEHREGENKGNQGKGNQGKGREGEKGKSGKH